MATVLPIDGISHRVLTVPSAFDGPAVVYGTVLPTKGVVTPRLLPSLKLRS